MRIVSTESMLMSGKADAAFLEIQERRRLGWKATSDVVVTRHRTKGWGVLTIFVIWHSQSIGCGWPMHDSLTVFGFSWNKGERRRLSWNAALDLLVTWHRTRGQVYSLLVASPSSFSTHNPIIFVIRHGWCIGCGQWTGTHHQYNYWSCSQTLLIKMV